MEEPRETPPDEEPSKEEQRTAREQLRDTWQPAAETYRNRDLERVFYRPVSFSSVYVSTIFTEFLGIAIRFWFLGVIAFVITTPVVLASTAVYGLASVLNLDWLRVMGAFFGIWLVLLLIPCRRIVASIITVITGVGYDAETAYQLGAREPTREERRSIIQGLELIMARKPKIGDLVGPDEWLVIDNPIPNSYTVGRYSYVTSAALKQAGLPALMAHELGHYKQGDGRRMMALRRLVSPLAFFLGLDRQATPIGVISGGRMAPVNPRGDDERIYFRVNSWKIQQEAAVKLGGFGLLMNGLEWARFWRQQDFEADAYASELGFAEELSDILEQYQVFDIAQPFLMSGRPYTAERIDMLRE